jgi:hypothetical protein
MVETPAATPKEMGISAAISASGAVMLNKQEKPVTANPQKDEAAVRYDLVATSEASAFQEIDLKVDDEDAIAEVLKRRAMDVYGTKKAAPDDAIFGTKALQKYVDRKDYRNQHPGDALPEHLVLTKQEIAAAYFEILAEERVLLDALGMDATTLARFKSAKTDFKKNDQGSHIVLWLKTMGIDKNPEEMLKRAKKVEALRRKMFHSITGENKDTREFQAWTGVSNKDLVDAKAQAGNRMHQAIREAILGKGTDAGDMEEESKRSGILGRDKYKKYYTDPNRKWEEMSFEERQKIWDNLNDVNLQNELIYEAIQIGAGEFCEDMGRQIQRELAGKVVTEEDRVQIKAALNKHTHEGKEKIASEKEAADIKVEKLKGELREKEARFAVLENSSTAADQSIAQAEKAHQDAVDEHASRIPSLNGQIAHLNFQRNQILGDLTAAKQLRDAVPLDAASQPMRLDAEKQVAYYQGLLDKVEDEIPKKEKERDGLDTKVSQALREKSARETERDNIKNRLEGLGGVTKLQDDLDHAIHDQKVKVEAFHDSEHDVISSSDRTGQALNKVLIISEEASYNKMMDHFFSAEVTLSEFAGTKEVTLEGGTPTNTFSGVNAFRKEVLEHFAGHPEIKSDAMLNEMMVSELDYIRVMVKALRMTDIDMSVVDSPANRALFDNLGKALKEYDASIPAKVTALNTARAVIPHEIKSAIKQILDEIPKHNKWEVSQALRLSVTELKNRAMVGKPLEQGEFKAPEPLMRKEEKIEPPPVRKSIAKDLFEHNKAIGLESIVRTVNIPDGPHKGEYYIVVTAKKDTTGPPPTWKTKHEVLGKKWKSYGEVTQEAIDAGRVSQEAGDLRGELLMRSAMEYLNEEIDKSANREFAIGGRTYTREPGTNKILLTAGPEKTARPGEKIYLEEEITAGGDLPKSLIDVGNNIITYMQDTLKNYSDNYRNITGKADVKRKPGESNISWHDKAFPGDEIKVDFGPRAKPDITLDINGRYSGGIAFAAVYHNFDDFDINLRLQTGTRALDFYAGMFQDLMDRNNMARNSYLEDRKGMPLVETDIANYGKVRITVEKGQLMIDRITDSSAGGPPVNLSQEKQRHQNLLDYLNDEIQNNAGYAPIIRQIEAAVGKEYARELWERSQKPIDTYGLI